MTRSSRTPVDLMFDALEAEKPTTSPSVSTKSTSWLRAKPPKSILISCGARLAVFDIAELPEATANDDLLELDIPAKWQAGKGAGYARWAKVLDLRQTAQTDEL